MHRNVLQVLLIRNGKIGMEFKPTLSISRLEDSDFVCLLERDSSASLFVTTSRWIGPLKIELIDNIPTPP